MEEKEESCSLYYRSGSSDKVYEVSLKKKNKGWVVDFAYGRRNSSLNTGSKTLVEVAYSSARRVYEKLIQEKQAKGYTVSNTGQSFVGTVSEARNTGVIPQLLNFLEESELEKYLTDDNWCAQEKHDGKNRLLFTGLKGAQVANRKGLTVGIDKNREKDLQSFPEGLIFNGEDMGEIVYLFDIIDDEHKNISYKNRIILLEDILGDETIPLDLLRVVYTAWSTKEKRSLLKRLLKESAEGIVFKDIRAPYTPGRPASGGNMLKYKFTQSCSCIVNGINKSKRSVSLMVYSDLSEYKTISIGNVTVYPNQEIPSMGDVVEVKYLYYFPNGSLFQPVLLSVRTDIDPEECLLSQLKLKQESDE